MSRWLMIVLAALGVAPLADAQAPPRNPHGALALPCQNCHTTTSWAPLRVTPEFNHDRDTKYPLRGMHSAVTCNACHVSKVFSDTSTQCADCHADLHQRQFGARCESCHTVRGWRANNRSVQDHWNRFPLLGAHATATCDDCHKGAAVGVYVGLSTQCVSCHLNDFQQARSVNHVTAGFSTACETCHNVNQWLNARFDHTRFAHFALTGAHAALDCSTCHANGQFQSAPTDCFGCHARDFASTTNPNHVAAGFPQDCSGCHTTTNWLNATFNHSTTGFTLTGAHAAVACASCHVGGKFAGTATACSGCHMPDYAATTNPNHQKAGFPLQCDGCHTTASWQTATFNHNLTKFPLTGAHVSVSCAQCHANNQFTAISTDCVSCHLKDFQGAASPNHVAAGFPQDCSVCHTTVNWTGATFNHNTTKFPLTGAHTSVTCVTCHVNNQFATLSTACLSCHLNDWQGTNNPNHAAAGFPQDCTVCHSTVNWSGATFNHTTQTKFPLTGAHTAVACATCHSNNVFAGLSVACISCHTKDWQGTNNPNHVAAGFPQDCSLCHTTVGWTGATFNHDLTKFPLTGAHTTVACATCHVGGNFTTLNTACISCHTKDWQGTSNPSHVAAGFPQDCSICHSTANWLNATFNHSTQTKFPLTGAHTSVACATCHVNNVFAGLSMQCISCHQKDWQGTNNPSHAAAGFPQDCSICHSTMNWLNATFNHSTQTKFPLTGAHTAVACATCHVNNVFAGLSMQCISCHQKDWQSTNNPNHAAAGFPQDCSVCHSTVNWLNATFNHSTQTKFPLTGAHTTVACATCHVNNVYAGLSMLCISCHQKDWQSTNNPNHVAAGFPQDCSQCHTTTNWLGATFNHNTQTKFPLTGAHTMATCIQCHASGVYAGLSMACYSCHANDYQGATNPNHVALGFPQDCSQCHTTTDWSGATFNHASTGFPLTGKHATTQCAQCHVNNNYHLTSAACYPCHASDYNGTNNPPHAAAGFPQDCSLCHTTTDWTGATFNHATTGFTLTGKHLTTTCSQCHVNNNYNLTSAACYPCHVSDYSGTNNPPHASSGFPQDCSLCHTTTDWTGATFNHATTGFTLLGKHATITCNQCHVGNNYNLTSTACFTCHAADYNGTTNPNHAAAQFPKTCDTCHNFNSWAGAVFNHTWFPMTHGNANSVCSTCHTNSNDYSVFQCTGCHAQAQTASAHSGIRNYVYNSTNCYACHPTGSNN